jgi:hypothetical protein
MERFASGVLQLAGKPNDPVEIVGAQCHGVELPMGHNPKTRQWPPWLDVRYFRPVRDSVAYFLKYVKPNSPEAFEAAFREVERRVSLSGQPKPAQKGTPTSAKAKGKSAKPSLRGIRGQGPLPEGRASTEPAGKQTARGVGSPAGIAAIHNLLAAWLTRRLVVPGRGGKMVCP